MKKFFLICVMLVANTSFAVDYAAIRSGTWKSPANWVGGSVVMLSDDAPDPPYSFRNEYFPYYTPAEWDNVYIGSKFSGPQPCVKPATVATMSVTNTPLSVTDLHLGFGPGTVGKLNMNWLPLSAEQLFLGEYGGQGQLLNRGPLNVGFLNATNQNFDLTQDDLVSEFSLTNGTASINNTQACSGLYLTNATAKWNVSYGSLMIAQNSIATPVGAGNVDCMVSVLSGSKLTLNNDMLLYDWIGVENGTPGYDAGTGSILDMAGHSLTTPEFEFGTSGQATLLNQGRLIIGKLTVGSGNTLTLNSGDIVSTSTVVKGQAVLTLKGSAVQTALMSPDRGRVDIQDKGTKLVLDYTGGTSPIQSVLAELVKGKDNFWLPSSGGRVFSTTCAFDVAALGWVDNGHAITIMETLPGDMDLDGVVLYNDISMVAAHYGGTGTWGVGDFNYDGNVNFADLNALVGNYTGVYNIPVEADHLDVQGKNLLTSHGFTLQYPEPGTFALLAASFICLLIWKKPFKRD